MIQNGAINIFIIYMSYYQLFEVCVADGNCRLIPQCVAR